MSHGTQDTARPHQPFAYGTITLFGGAFQPALAKLLHTTTRSYNPGRTTKITKKLQLKNDCSHANMFCWKRVIVKSFVMINTPVVNEV